MSKELEAVEKILNTFVKILLKTKCEIPTAVNIEYLTTSLRLAFHNELDLIETALKEKEKNDFELEVFKLAYEWKCNGVNGTYEEVLNKASKTVEGWKEIERKGYGTIIAE